MDNKVKDIIRRYSEVYRDFESIQNSSKKLLPTGDQKTGVIAEYYAKCYIEHIYQVIAEYAKPGAFYDISYKTKKGRLIRVQVKGVSAYSKTRTIAPLNIRSKKKTGAFDELFLIDLGLDFLPIAFYINTFDQIIQQLKDTKRKRVLGSKMKDLNSQKSKGSRIYDFSNNKVLDLIQALE
ncbi:MAG: hypothetical protein ABJE80_22805 [Reichenbachiella sp.]|uniref:hypothetical protein n=1 Tax=Reichenbachiella sp. TaxID=2184521 RepID=UPI00326428F9